MSDSAEQHEGRTGRHLSTFIAGLIVGAVVAVGAMVALGYGAGRYTMHLPDSSTVIVMLDRFTGTVKLVDMKNNIRRAYYFNDPTQ